MQINGFNKFTLLDYPKHLASTIFLGGCNFRCPFCHNSSLVLSAGSQPVIPIDDVMSYLDKRKGVLEGVCISGGEPTLCPELSDLIRRIKALGYKVKLDTNGTRPKIIKDLAEGGLIDYVAMDIKNSKEHYYLSAGISNFSLEPIEESVSYLLSGPVSYEFRTTLVKEHHTDRDMLSIGNWIKGADAYFLQSFEDSGDILMPGLTAPKKEVMQHYVELLKPFVKSVQIRGL